MNVPQRLIGKTEVSNILISYRRGRKAPYIRTYTIWNIMTGEVGENLFSRKEFKTPARVGRNIYREDKFREKASITFSIVSPTLLYEEDTRVVYDFKQNKYIKYTEDRYEAIIPISDNEFIAKNRDKDVYVISNISMNEETEFTLGEGGEDYDPTDYIPQTRDLIIYKGLEESTMYKRYNIDTKKITPLIDTEKYLTVLDNGEIALYDHGSGNININDHIISTKLTGVRGIIKISTNKYIVLGTEYTDDNRDYKLYLVNESGNTEMILEDYEFLSYSTQLINIPSIGCFAVIYTEYSEIDDDDSKRFFLLIKYEDFTIYKKIEFREGDRIKFRSFYQKEAREYANIVANYIEKKRYVSKPLSRIIAKFI